MESCLRLRRIINKSLSVRKYWVIYWKTSPPVLQQQIAYFIGLDLGQSQDFSAMAILERHGTSKHDYVFHCRHLHRWKLRTSYPAIVAESVAIANDPKLRSPNRKPLLAVDATGVGAPVIDLFKKAMLHAKLEPVQIVGGSTVSKEHGLNRVPKRDLFSVVQVALQNGRFRIAEIRLKKTNEQIATYKRESIKGNTETRDNLHRRVFGLSFPLTATEADKQAARLNYRDALFRADSITDENQALRQLGRARMTGDNELAKAIAARAYEQGWDRTLNEYASQSESIKRNLKELIDYERDLGNVKIRVADSASFSMLPESTEEQVARLSGKNLW